MTDSSRFILSGLLGILELLEFLTEPMTIAIGLFISLYSWIAISMANLLRWLG